MGDKKKRDKEEHELEPFDLFGFVTEMMSKIEPRSQFALATIAPDHKAGLPGIQLEGQLGEIERGCAYLSGYEPKAGDRVLVVQSGLGYVILGKVVTA